MNIEGEDIEEQYANIFKPIKDLALSFDVNIDELISNYIVTIHEQTLSMSEGCKLDFTLAAFILRHSVDVYGKKVEYLYQLINEFLNDAKTSKKTSSESNELNISNTNEKHKMLRFDEIPSKTFLINNDFLQSNQEINYKTPSFLKQSTMNNTNVKFPMIDDNDIASQCVCLQLFDKNYVFNCSNNDIITNNDIVENEIVDDVENDNLYDDIIENNQNNDIPNDNSNMDVDDVLQPLNDICIRKELPKRNLRPLDQNNKVQSKTPLFEFLDPAEIQTMPKITNKKYRPKNKNLNKEKIENIKESNSDFFGIYFKKFKNIDELVVKAWVSYLKKHNKLIKIAKTQKDTLKITKSTYTLPENNLAKDVDSEQENWMEESDIEGEREEDEVNMEIIDDIFPQNDLIFENINKETYEYLNSNKVSQYIKESREVLVQTELGEIISNWEGRVLPRLQEESLRRSFNIHVYAKEMIDKLLNIEKSTSIEVSFYHLTENLPPFEITRYFQSILLLANHGNVEILQKENEMYLLLLDGVRADYALAQH